MRTTLYSRIAGPTETAVFRAQRLRQTLNATLLAVLVCLAQSLAHRAWHIGALLALTTGVLGLAYWYARRGNSALATTLMLGTVMVTMGIFVYAYGGVRDPAMLAFPPVLILAVMLGGRRLFLGLFFAMLIVVAGIVVADMHGWHTNIVPPVGTATFVDIAAILAVTAYVAWIMGSDLRSALLRLERENERIRTSYARIEVLANHDALTGLPNRMMARDRFVQAIASRDHDQITAALLFLDLDAFKAVNDSLGHAAGDKLLRLAGQRLEEAVRDIDTVSRQGGDEFLIVLGHAGGSDLIAQIAQQVIDRMAEPFDVDGMTLTLTCSIGIARYPEDGRDFDSLLRRADMAMYRAKESGRNVYCFFEEEMDSCVIEQLRMIADLRLALERQEFSLYYQPQHDLRTGHIVGTEALLRWRHPDAGMVTPGEFIPVAERSGQIHAIGAWVLRAACRQARAWHDAGLGRLVVAVNLSTLQFRRDNIEHEILKVLDDEDLAPGSIELEITESLLIADTGHLRALLGRLRARGLRVSIDDFGTGYSNLCYLKDFKVECLKIDQSFVRQMTKDAGDESIVRAVTQMAHGLGMEVVAEGVEDVATLERLIELGCEYGQGFYWSPALPADEFARYVVAHRQLVA